MAREHHRLGKMLGIGGKGRRQTSLDLDKDTHTQAVEEHHFLGSLIGLLGRAAPALMRGAGMAAKVGAGAARMAAPAARMAARGAVAGAKGLGKVAAGTGKVLAKNAKNIGHAANAAGAIASTGMQYHQMKQADKAAAAQERMMNAQADGAEASNAYMKKQMTDASAPTPADDEPAIVRRRGGSIRSRR